MEFNSSQIAGLVLGYLKSEECYEAYNEFLDSCEHFSNNRENIKMGKYFATRVMGMSLIDFLEEYATIYSIVQGRLEVTNYYSQKRPKATLAEQLLFLLDTGPTHLHSSTPICSSSEVETTPAHALPGNADSEEADQKATPKRKTRLRSREPHKSDKPDFDVSEAFTQTLLEKPELLEKIAETINVVRGTPEVAKSTNDEISAGASKELDAIIKTVVQITEEDPSYNKMFDEMIGTSSADSHAGRRSNSGANAHQGQLEEGLKSKRVGPKGDKPAPVSTIDDHNNDAVQSIIAASQVGENQGSGCVAPAANQGALNKSAGNSEIYVFDGTLDTYLKSSGGGGGGSTNPNPNPVYISTGGLLVVPQVPGQYDDSAKQYYVVNNQPLINVNVPAVKSVISDSDIMAMPTIIVSDEVQASYSVVTSAGDKGVPQSVKQNTVASQKPVAITPQKPNTTAPQKSSTVASQKPNATAPPKPNITAPQMINGNQAETRPPPSKENETAEETKENKCEHAIIAAAPVTPLAVKPAPPPRNPTPRHVRNLDFSTPLKSAEEKPPKSRPAGSKLKSWDADLRVMAGNCAVAATPRRKKPVVKPKKKTVKGKAKPEKAEESEEKPPEVEAGTEEGPVEAATEAEKPAEEKAGRPELESPTDKVGHLLKTPMKEDGVPKTPGAGVNFQCTPFNQVLEEQLRGVDLISLPTPNLPITPGFALTPSADLAPYNHRSTDYSTSSSYYQPSDTEHNKSIEQLLEESKAYEEKAKLNIISDIVVKAPKNASESTKKSHSDHLKKFNHNVIGRKNLNLLNAQSSSSSSSSSDDDSDSSSTSSDMSEEQSNSTIICKGRVEKKERDTISDIISTIEVKDTLSEDKKKSIRSDLEEIRKRTAKKIQAPAQKKKPVRGKLKPVPTPVRKKVEAAKRTKPAAEEAKGGADEEAQNLVKGLAQRGIHLVPNKSPTKKSATAAAEDEAKSEDEVLFDRKTFEDVIEATHDGAARGKVANYDLTRLEKGFGASVYVERFDCEMNRTMRCTPFHTLLDLDPKVNVLVPRRSKRNETAGTSKESPEKAASAKEKSDEAAENELMDCVVAGSMGEDSPDGKPSSKSGKKRKGRNSEEEKQTEKKAKINIKLLKNIDVDTFLDKVHGEF